MGGDLSWSAAGYLDEWQGYTNPPHRVEIPSTWRAWIVYCKELAGPNGFDIMFNSIDPIRFLLRQEKLRARKRARPASQCGLSNSGMLSKGKAQELPP